MKAALAIAVLLVSTPAFAQTSPGPPGPYVIDVGGAMSGIPSASDFLPPVPPATLVPKRGFGFYIGASVYHFHLGPATLGLGVSMVNARGTAPTSALTLAAGSTSSSSGTTTPSTDTTTPTTTGTTPVPAATFSTASPIMTTSTVSILSPELSFNFGTRNGWSYLSAGYGSARISSEATGQAAPPYSGALTLIQNGKRADAINYGGGARWFFKDHLGFGFDLRFQKIAKTLTRPPTSAFMLSVGVALR